MKKNAKVTRKKKSIKIYPRLTVGFLQKAHRAGLSYKQLLDIFAIAPGSLNYLLRRDLKSVRE